MSVRYSSMCMQQDYRVLLYQISLQITERELNGIKFLCAESVPASTLEGTVLELFRELEKREKLGVDRLGFLINILEQVQRADLAQMLRRFQTLREVYLSELHRGTGAISTLEGQHEFRYSHGRSRDSVVTDHGAVVPPRHLSTTHTREGPHQPPNTRDPGEVTVHCIFKMASVGAWLGGCAYILNQHRADPAALAAVMTTVVLPAGFMVKYMTSGSIKVVLWTDDLAALEELWNRYQSGQLCEDMEKGLVTDDLKKLAGGEEIELSVVIDEYEYKNACFDLIVARNTANRIVSSIPRQPRRVKSLENITLPAIQPATEKHAPIVPIERPKDLLLSPCRVRQLTKESSASSSGFCSSMSSESETSHALLSEFLHKSSKVNDICGSLDREMIVCHDWRSLASKFSYKMREIRLLERKESPSLALLEDVAFKTPETKLSELIDKLSELERDDVVDQIIGGKDNDDPRALSNIPFEVRKKFALELDHGTLAQFTDVVHNIVKCVKPSEIAAFHKRPSPAMSLLEELETVFPELDVSHLQEACRKGGVGTAVEVLEEYLTSITPKEIKVTSTTKRRKSLHKLHQVCGDSGLGLSTPPVQSPTEEAPRRSFPFKKS